MIRQLGLVGCGLMAGSFALALRRAGLVERVVAFSPSERTTRRALELNIIDQRAESAAQAVSGSDVVLLGVPVRSTQACLSELRDHLAPDALLMDVGSTKGDVVAAARAALGERLDCFVPAHPIAGKESAGIDHAETWTTHESTVRYITTPVRRECVRRAPEDRGARAPGVGGVCRRRHLRGVP